MSNIEIATTGLRAEINPMGAELTRLRSGDGRDFLWDGDLAIWNGRAPLLFPFVGGLAGDGYNYNGERFAMPRHGFARRSVFTLTDQSASSAEFTLAANPETRTIYPFEFALHILFEVMENTLRMQVSVKNEDDRPMPYNFGFHPALRWPLPDGSPRGEHVIAFDQPELAPVRRLNSQGLLNDERFPTPVAEQTLLLNDDLFVEDALIFDQLRSRRLNYRGSSGETVDISWDNLSDFALWSKPGAGYICIEPWQGHADPAGFDGDIWHKPGIMAIGPGETHFFEMRIALKADPAKTNSISA